MKIMIKLMLLALVGLLVAPLIIKGPDGKPLMTVQDLDLNLPSVSPASAYKDPSYRSSGLTTVYKWQDEHGQWHFSDNQSQGSNHQTLKYNPKANIIQSLPKEDDSQQTTLSALSGNEFIGNAVSSRTRPKETSQDENVEVMQQIKRALGGNNHTTNQSAGYSSGAGISLSTIPLSEVPELIEQAKNIQSLLDQRNKDLEKALAR